MAQIADKTLAQPRALRVTLEEYERMSRLGAFEGKRVELIEGEIVEMPSMDDPHYDAIARLNAQLTVRLYGLAVVVPQVPVKLTMNQSEPEPDFTIIPKASYQSKVPDENSVVWVVEVSDSTLSYDRNRKLPMYAKNGIAEVWIVNLQDNQLEVYTDPQTDEYLTRRTYKPQEAVASKTFPEISIEWW